MKIKTIKWIKYEKISNDEDDIEDNDWTASEGESMPFPLRFGNDFENTPCGPFKDDDPLNPHNLYDEMYFGHFIGFNINNTNFTKVILNNETKALTKVLAIDLVEGVSMWRIIDPHTIIVAPAKYYDWAEVSKEIEKVILGDQEQINKLIHKGKKISNDILQNYENKNHFVLVLPNGKIISKANIGDTKEYEISLDQAKELFLDEPNSFFIVDGEPMERSS